jgi:hypothetical protein
MTTAYTSLLGLALPVTGELSGTWGDTVNNSITSLLDSAIAGTQTLTADTTLTTTTGAANQSRQAILLCSPASVNITITAPAQSKIYTVINTSATYTVKIRGVGPTTGVTLAVSESAVVAWNGTDFIRISSNSATTGNFTVNGNLTVTGNTTLGDADTDTITQTASYVTGTQLKSAKTATNTLNLAAYDTGGAAYTNLITLTASATPTLALTSTGVGTINNMSIGATTAAAGTFTSITDSGNLTFTGTGNRITGDFSNATIASRVAFQTSTTNAATTLQVLPNGTSVQAAINLEGDPAATTGGVGQFTITSTDVRISSSIRGASSYLPITFYNGGSERMRLDTSGNLGIGTSSPTAKLEILDNVNGQLKAAIRNSNAGSSAYAQWLFGNDSNANAAAITLNSSTNTASLGGANSLNIYQGLSAPITFQTNGTTRMTLDAAGNLGIGTTTIPQKLTVGATTDSVNTAIINSSSVGRSALVVNANTASAAELAVNFTGSTDAYGVVTSAIGLHVLNANPLTFGTNATERMRIDSVGNAQFQAGAVMPYAPAPTGIAAATTLTNAQIQGQIISATGTTYTITMPLGTTLETLATWATTNIAYDFFVINTATGVITMAVNTGVTSLGSLTIAIGASAHFRLRRTAANTFVLYRLV